MSHYEYVKLVECREADLAKHQHFYDAFIQLKDYNTSLRMAIVNIPSTNKGINQQAIKRAKRLANKEPAPLLPVTPKPKRAYNRRNQTPSSRERTTDSISLDHSESSESTTSSDSLSTVTSSNSESSINSNSSSESGEGDKSVHNNNTITVEDNFI